MGRGALIRRAIAAAVAAATFAGCTATTPASQAPPAAPASPSPSAVPSGALDAAGLRGALEAGDRDRFLDFFARRGYSQVLGRRLWRNWTRIGVQDLESDGSPAGLQRLTVRWTPVRDGKPFAESISLYVEGGRITKADLGYRPLWAMEDLDVVARGNARMIVAVNTPRRTRDRWLKPADQAVRRLAAMKLGPAARGWDGSLVAQLPRTREQFAMTVEMMAQQTDGIAGLADCGFRDEACLVAINPSESESADQEWLSVLMTHEAIHVAIHQADRESQLPSWVSEGVAEALSTSNTSVRGDNRAVARQAVRRTFPKRLPSEDDFASDNPDRVDAAYALSEQAVLALRAKYGHGRVMGWIGHWNTADRPSDKELTRVYLAALRRL